MTPDWNASADFSLEGGPALIVVFAVLFVIYGIPSMRIVRRVGFASWWGVLAAVPVVNIVALWVFAFRAWPTDERR